MPPRFARETLLLVERWLDFFHTCLMLVSRIRRGYANKALKKRNWGHQIKL